MTIASKVKDTLLRSHPYFPPALDLPEWQPLVLSYERILGTFFVTAALIAIVTLIYACKASDHLGFPQNSEVEAFRCTFTSRVPLICALLVFCEVKMLF